MRHPARPLIFLLFMLSLRDYYCKIGLNESFAFVNESSKESCHGKNRPVEICPPPNAD